MPFLLLSPYDSTGRQDRAIQERNHQLREGGISAGESFRPGQARDMLNKPTVFISSSSEGLELAHSLRTILEPDATTVIWTDSVFSPGEFSSDSLLKALDTVDFAAIVLTSDDLVPSRNRSETSPRENVIFELGLFLGRLGRSRIIVLMAEDSPTRLPSDLAGVMVARFRRRDGENILASLGPASRLIREQISSIARLDKSARSKTLIENYSCFISYSARDAAFAERIYNDLQDVGIRCWLDRKDLKVGGEIGVQIDQALQLTDKVLLILSEASVASAWVRREIEGALRKEAKAEKTILFPIRIDEAVMHASDPTSYSLVSKRHIGDFTNWKTEGSYRSAFSRLVKDLTVSAAVEQRRGI